MRSLPALTISTLLVAVLSIGCAARPTHTITVFAAASLQSPFTDLVVRFERAHPETTVALTFAGSSSLATQLIQGAPADVFASADAANMAEVVDAGLVSGDPIPFAANTLTIVTPPGNPANVTSIADLARPGVQVVVCAPQVPCGAATRKIEQAAGVTLAPVSEESAVTDVLGKITSGQADAGLVYVTDAAGAGSDVTAIAVPESAQAPNTYPIGVLESSTDPVAAREFVELVTGPIGQDVLAAAGFARP